jgi:hypothetical protein
MARMRAKVWKNQPKELVVLITILLFCKVDLFVTNSFKGLEKQTINPLKCRLVAAQKKVKPVAIL